MKLLFLDFDGVLHPDAVYRRLDGRIELRAHGALFMWAPLLGAVVEESNDLQIVLSSSWVRQLGFRKARAALPAVIADKVVGATWHSAMATSLEDIAWDRQTRYEQISAYLRGLPAAHSWLALDDDAVGWPDCKRRHLLQTKPDIGLADPLILERLGAFLRGPGEVPLSAGS